MSHATPDMNDMDWADVEHDTKTIDCIGGDHRDCSLAEFCQCTCHDEPRP